MPSANSHRCLADTFQPVTPGTLSAAPPPHSKGTRPGRNRCQPSPAISCQSWAGCHIAHPSIEPLRTPYAAGWCQAHGSKAAGVKGVKWPAVRFKGAPPRRSGRSRLCAWHRWDRGPDPTEASRAYKRSAKAAHKPPRPANSAGPGPAGLRRAAESLWPAGSPDDRINDRPPGIFHLGREPHGSLGCGWSAPQTALSTRGRFCCAEAETWDARSIWRPATG